MTDEVDTTRNSTVGASGDGRIPPETDAPTSEERGRERRRRVNRTAIEWAVLVVAAVVIALVIKTFLFQAFYIPSESMVPTLEVGDRVLVNKLSYDLHDLHRGDIVVFSAEPNARWHRAGIDDLVKRVIALPGETVTQCETDRICINGRLLGESYLPKQNGSVIPTTMPGTIPGCDAGSPPNGCKVPAGQVFVMGDNRGNSQDARANGPIKESSIVGRVFLRIWPPGRIGFM